MTNAQNCVVISHIDRTDAQQSAGWMKKRLLLIFASTFDRILPNVPIAGWSNDRDVAPLAPGQNSEVSYVRADLFIGEENLKVRYTFRQTPYHSLTH